MLELGRREWHLMGGLTTQILVVGLLVFVYTQAIRQIQHQGRLHDQLQERLTMAREEVARTDPGADVTALKGKSAALLARFHTYDNWVAASGALKWLASEVYGAQNLRLQLSEESTKTIEIPLEGQPDLKMQLHALEMHGTVTSQNAAGLLIALRNPKMKFLCPLVSLELAAADPDELQPVDFSFKWWVVTDLEAEGDRVLSQMRPEAPQSIQLPLESHPVADWSLRIEPFQSPLLYASALSRKLEGTSGLQLDGILWDAESPSCVISGHPLKPGEWVQGHQLILITPKSALLQDDAQELLLNLP